MIEITVDREVIANLFPHPKHVRSVQQHIERYVLRHTSQAGCGIGLQISIAVFLCFVLHAFLVMGLAIGHIAVFIGFAKTVSVFEPSHRRLAIRVSGVGPTLHAVTNQLRTLRAHVTAPMLKNHICIRRNGFNTLVVIVLQIVYCGIRFIRTKTVTQVKTVPVHFVLLQPVLEGADKHLVRRLKTVIPILIDIVGVRRVDIKPRVAGQVRSVRIEFIHRIITRSMVEHHIKNNGNTALVALVDELLVHRLRAVGPIRRKIVVRRIAPVIVSVKLTYRHQLYRIHTQILDIIQTLHQTFERTAFGIVVYPQLVNHQVVLVWTLEVQCRIGPLELRLTGLNHRHIAVCAFTRRVIQQVRIHFLRFILIIRVQHFLRIQIGDLLLHAIRTLYGILEAIFLARLQPRKRNPEIVTVLIQLIIRTEFPIRHVAQQEHALGRLRLTGRIGTQRDRRTIFAVVDTIAHACRTGFLYRCHTGHIIPIGCIRAQSKYAEIYHT